MMAIVWLGTVVTAMSTVLGYTRCYLVSRLQQFCSLPFYLLTMLKQLQRPEVVDRHLHYVQQENLTTRRLNSLTDRQATQVAATQLHLNDFIEVHAGELVPADGEIVEGFLQLLMNRLLQVSLHLCYVKLEQTVQVLLVEPKFLQIVLLCK